MDTGHTIEVNITKKNLCYAGVTSPNPSKSSKAKDHTQALDRCITLWDEGNIEGLLYEGMTSEQRLRSDKENMTVAKISLKFKNLLSKGNVNGALKLLTDNMHSGILPFNNETTQGDPTSMATYTLGILPVLHSLLDFVFINDLQTKEVAFADDFTVAGKLAVIKNFWDKLAITGPKYGCFPKSTKSYLTVKKIA